MTITLVTSNEGVLTVLIGTCIFLLAGKANSLEAVSISAPIDLHLPAAGHFLKHGRDTDPIGSLRNDCAYILPMMLVLLLLKVDVRAAIRVMGRGIYVMLFGTLGVVLAHSIAYLLVAQVAIACRLESLWHTRWQLDWRTGNMAGVSEMIDTPGTEFGLAVLGDTTIYLIWLPIMLSSKRL